MFSELKRYNDKYGDCDVPRTWPENPNLAVWVGNQRALFRKQELSKDRKARLDEIDFVWHTRKHNWEHMFAELQRYKKTYRNCNVPLNWPDNPKLSKWVREQRAKRRSISAARRARLDDLEFVWAPYDAIWDQMFQQLKSYREQHGDCNVPLYWPQNPKLSHWVVNQRQFQRRGKLKPERTKRLEALGFEWSLRNRS